MRANKILAAACVLLNTTSAMAQSEIPLWPDLTIGGTPPIVERGTTERPNRSVRGEFAPTLTTYLPTRNPTGAAVILCPGGGYGSLAVDLHGHEMARWFQERGVAGLVLKYRLGKRNATLDAFPEPFQDARRALQLARDNAAKWNLRFDRIGMMGFSAGGHLAANASTLFAKSEKPDFLILVSPVISIKTELQNAGTRISLLGNQPDSRLIERYSAELNVSSLVPPTLIIHAQNDGAAPPAASKLFVDELRKHDVPATLFSPRDGGHGIQLGITGEAAAWTQRMESWMRERGLMIGFGE